MIELNVYQQIAVLVGIVVAVWLVIYYGYRLIVLIRKRRGGKRLRITVFDASMYVIGEHIQILIDRENSVYELHEIVGIKGNELTLRPTGK